MVNTQILRVARTDAQGAFVLLNVSQQSEAKPLNLKLVATEYEHVYHASIKETSVKSLQHGNYAGDLDEWKTVLQFALLKKRPAAIVPDSCQGLELAAALNGNTLTVTLRKNIAGIKHGLGAIQFEQDDEREEINGFEWAETAVSHLDSSRAELETLEASLSSQKDEIARLSAQLDELVKVKKEHEQELLKKFVALLNSKKLKIRDQQRLLGDGTKVWHNDADAVHNARAADGARSSRRGKRKAESEVKDEPADSDDGFEAAQDDEMADDEDRDKVETPQLSEEEDTEDESEDIASAAAAHQESSKRESSDTMDVEREDANTSKRTLPTRHLQRQQEPSQRALNGGGTAAANDADDDDEETDDEL